MLLPLPKKIRILPPGPVYCLLLGCVLLFYNRAAAQDFQQQRLQLVGYNVGFNAVIGGIGAAINKKPEQTLGNAFLRGMGKGALGGLVIHGAKTSVHQLYQHQKLGWAWPARLANALGSAMVQNAAANQGLLDQLHLNLWLFRADFNLKEKQFLFRLAPTQLAGALYLSRYGKFNFSSSLQSGLMYYDIPSESLMNSGTYGYSLTTAVAVGTPYYSAYQYYEVVAHELLHNLQYESATWLNPYFAKGDRVAKQRSGFYKTTARYVYLDLNILAKSPLRLFRSKGDCHFSRFTEMEAHHYATRAYIDCEDDYSGIGMW